MSADILDKAAARPMPSPPDAAADDPIIRSLFHRHSPNGNPSDDNAAPPPVNSDGAPVVAERTRMVAELEERLRFETLLSDLSARFINLPVDEVDKEIEAALGRIVQFLGLDRSTLFQLSEDETTLVVSHCWAAPGFVSSNGLIPRDLVPWGLAKALRGETIVFSSVDELPEEAAQDKATFRKIGPKANVTFPLRAGGGAVFGALGFGKITEDRPWPENQIQRLRLFAQILANALLRSARSRSCGRRSPRSSSSRSGCCRRTSISARKPAFCTTTTTSSGRARPSSRPSPRWSRWRAPTPPCCCSAKPAPARS